MRRDRRSMPSPVEALPCGSRSTISTCSPMAASAVPRLIAVVVLPTPPFWLAIASTRGRPAVGPGRRLCERNDLGADRFGGRVSVISASVGFSGRFRVVQRS